MSIKKVAKILFNIPKGYAEMQRQARRRDKYFSISPAFYEEVIKKGCFYCGTSLMDKKGSSLDRVNSKGHYTPDNVVGCCGTCNFAKRSMNVDDFFTWVKRIAANIEKAEKEIVEIKNNKDQPWNGF